MASVGIILCNYPATTTHTLHFQTPKSTSIPLQQLALNSPFMPISLRKTTGGLSMVTRVGPGIGTYIFAFVLPLSLSSSSMSLLSLELSIGSTVISYRRFFIRFLLLPPTHFISFFVCVCFNN
ncbi:hypothetical protein CsSME_00043835 [Camellia sinensis var. sinensis]